MKKALISSIETLINFNGTQGYRVAQVELPEDIFPVAEGMFWFDCDDAVEQDKWYFDTTTNTVLICPTPIVPSNRQVISEGAQVF